MGMALREAPCSELSLNAGSPYPRLSLGQDGLGPALGSSP